MQWKSHSHLAVSKEYSRLEDKLELVAQDARLWHLAPAGYWLEYFFFFIAWTARNLQQRKCAFEGLHDLTCYRDAVWLRLCYTSNIWCDCCFISISTVKRKVKFAKRDDIRKMQTQFVSSLSFKNGTSDKMDRTVSGILHTSAAGKWLYLHAGLTSAGCASWVWSRHSITWVLTVSTRNPERVEKGSILRAVITRYFGDKHSLVLSKPTSEMAVFIETWCELTPRRYNICTLWRLTIVKFHNVTNTLPDGQSVYAWVCSGLSAYEPMAKKSLGAKFLRPLWFDLVK